ncbi:Conserved_hypothetical protein [Hexamita inflata]|uniref:Uncharacterized protein n=1 Tax=Hexamita inflata TaxID=28002 RepID=A0AA86PWT8_9EUKA|nr:Conserved hypothetical protein [Hexamita inflata]
MNSDLKIVAASVKSVESLSNEVVISSSHDGTSLKLITATRSGCNTIDFKNNLIKNKNQSQLEWEIQCLNSAVLSTTNSGIKYTMQFGIPMTANSIGRYYMQNNLIWFQKATIVYTTTAQTLLFDPPKAICTTAMNSAFPIYESIINYNGELKTTEVFRKSVFQQMYLPKDYQDTLNQTWFEGDSIIFDEYVLPYDETSGATDKLVDIFTSHTNWNNKLNPNIQKNADNSFTWIFRKDFFISFMMLNNGFAYDKNFYSNTVKSQGLKVMITLQNYDMANCFASSNVFDVNYTGIGAIDLVYVRKTSNVVQSGVDANKDGSVAQNGIMCETRPMTANFTGMQLDNETSSKRGSIAHAGLGLYRRDFNDADSTYLHQRYTSLSAAQILAYVNNQNKLNNATLTLTGTSKIDAGKGTAAVSNALDHAAIAALFLPKSQDFVFFGTHNVIRGGDIVLYHQDINDLQSIRNEIIRSTNANQQFTKGLAPSFSNVFEWISRYAFTYSSLEQFSMDEYSSDVVGDGFNGTINSLRFKYSLVEYRSGSRATEAQTIQDLADANLRPQNKGANALNIEAITFYDSLLIYDLKNGQINTKEFRI